MTMRERIENGKLFTDYCEGLPEERLHSNVVAVGNPCKIIREINERDDEFYYKDRKFSDSGIDEA